MSNNSVENAFSIVTSSTFFRMKMYGKCFFPDAIEKLIFGMIWVSSLALEIRRTELGERC